MPKIEGDSTFLLSTNMMKMSTNPKIADKKYVYYYFCQSHVKEFIKSSAGGGAQPIFNFTTLKNFEIELPNLSEQQKIAATLSAYDNLIDNNTRRIKILEEMAQAIYREWFVHFHFPGHENVRMVESELGLIPKGWEIKALNDEIESIKGLSYKGAGLANAGMPLHNLNSVLEGGGYKYLGIKFYIGDFKDKHRLKHGDIIVTNTEQGHEYRLIGFPAIVPKCFGADGIFSHHIFRVRPLPSSYLSRFFIYYLLMTEHVRNQIISYANGTTINMLSIDGLKTPKFAKPPKNLIESFDSIAGPTFERIELYRETNVNLHRTRDLLLPKLINGDIDVSGLDIGIPEAEA